MAERQDKTASIDMTKAINNIQAILNKNGYDAGKPDGVMGDKTKGDRGVPEGQRDGADGRGRRKTCAALLDRK